MFNIFFDKIYIITCKNFIERHDYIKNHFKKNNIQFDFIISTDKNLFDKKNITNSEKSLALSHLNCVVNAKLNNYQKILICEDDVNFIENINIEFEKFLKNLPQDWDFLQLGNAFWASHWLKRKYINENLYQFEWGSGSHCIAIKNTIFDTMIKRFEILNNPADFMYYSLFAESKCYCPENFLADQLSKNIYLKDNSGKYIFDSYLDIDRVK
jgi:hypothetical protein